MASATNVPEDRPALITTRFVFEADGKTPPPRGRAPERADLNENDPDRARFNRDDPFDIPIVWDR